MIHTKVDKKRVESMLCRYTLKKMHYYETVKIKAQEEKRKKIAVLYN